MMQYHEDDEDEFLFKRSCPTLFNEEKLMFKNNTYETITNW